jgi:hypothetical protein
VFSFFNIEFCFQFVWIVVDKLHDIVCGLGKGENNVGHIFIQDDTNVVAYLTYMNNTKDLIILGMNVILYTIF